ncbi:MAG: hypothetical protein U9Q82_04175, partial [Chloroflexota bacterium]|nr:hypothetical protein [Chloroflexota bacterium]
MRRKKTSIRIKGVVRSMNRVRELLNTNLTPQGAENLRKMVTKIVAAVDDACKEYGSTPDELPAPTRRAYHYLKDLNLDDLPVNKNAQAQSHHRKSIRITGLIKSSNMFHHKMSTYVRGIEYKAVQVSTRHEEFNIIKAAIESHVSQLGGLLQANDATAAALPIRSRRAYQWMRFLTTPDILEQHLKTLAKLYKIGHKVTFRKDAQRSFKSLKLDANIYHTSALFRARPKDKKLQFIVNEGFIGAPDNILKSVVCAAFLNNKKNYMATMRTYSMRESFAEIVIELEHLGMPIDKNTRGMFYDLEIVFERVNSVYFDGAMEKPNLIWSRILTQRKFGHYRPSSDTIMISISLDDSDVPTYLIDFIMYHELLHKKIGQKIINGRIYSHTSEFRAAESEFH